MAEPDGMLQIDRATLADVPFVMAVERLEGYEAVVGRWDEARHRAAFADGRHTYFIGRDMGEPIGFVILRDWDSPERVTLVKRIAVTTPGRRYGRRLLAAVADTVFRETDTYRLWLGVFPENARARRAYEAVGFVAEGVARGSAFFGGVHRDELTMSMLRGDWEGRAIHAG